MKQRLSFETTAWPLFSFLLLFASMTAHASDIASSVAGQSDNRSANGGYFELGASVYSVNKIDIRQAEHEAVTPSLLISGVYQYEGLFVETVHQSQDGINLGYNFWNSKNWSLDLLLANLKIILVRSEEIDITSLDETERNNYLMSEESLYVGAGFRATRYWDNDYVFQYRITTDYYDSQGLQSSARLGKSWQVKNWNFHALASVEYSSAKFNRRLFGISRQEATKLYPQYQPGSAINYGVEFGVAYPISQSIVFRALYRFNHISSEISNSPFIEANYVSFFNASVSYVF